VTLCAAGRTHKHSACAAICYSDFQLCSNEMRATYYDNKSRFVITVYELMQAYNCFAARARGGPCVDVTRQCPSCLHLKQRWYMLRTNLFISSRRYDKEPAANLDARCSGVFWVHVNAHWCGCRAAYFILYRHITHVATQNPP
jgi:hypothetical protein